MNIAWVYDCKLHKFWPISGTVIAGVIVIKWIVIAPGALVYVASTLCLAFYLVYYHLRNIKTSADI
jgi:hypothetical protein